MGYRLSGLTIAYFTQESDLMEEENFVLTFKEDAENSEKAEKGVTYQQNKEMYEDLVHEDDDTQNTLSQLTSAHPTHEEGKFPS